MVEQDTSPQDIESLSKRIALLEGELSSKRSRRAKSFVALAAVGLCTFIAGLATSQEEGCSDIVPFCFETGGAVKANEFNANFAALGDALAGKVDQSGDGDVDITGTLGLHIYTKACTAVSGESECTCEPGELALSGGASAPTNGSLVQSRPRASAIDTWQVRCADASGADVACTSVRAVCARMRDL